MGLFGTLRSAAHSSMALSAAINVTSNNIAGANDKDYDRQTAHLQANPYTGGVRLKAIIREVRPMLEHIQRLTISSTGYSEETAAIYRELSNIMGLNEEEITKLSQTVEDFVDAWHEYHVNPGSQSNRNELVRIAEHMTNTLREVSNDVAQFRFRLNAAAHTEVDDLNTELRNVQKLNERIAAARSAGDNSGSLESQRDGLIESISKKMAVTIFPRDHGQIGLYTSSGHDLVDKGFVSQFYFATDGTLHKTGLPNDAMFLDDDGNYRLTEGTLLGKLNALRDNLDEADPAVGILSRVEAQLDAFASLWVETTAADNTFSDAYDALPASNPPRAGELQTGFFVTDGGAPPDRFNILVNNVLLNDPDNIKRADIGNVVDALGVASRALNNTAGQHGNPLNINDKSYLEVVVSLVDHWSVYINDSQDLYDSNSDGLTRITDKLRSETGVDINEELSELTVLQNAYAANARVINAVTVMLDALLATVR